MQSAILKFVEGLQFDYHFFAYFSGKCETKSKIYQDQIIENCILYNP